MKLPQKVIALRDLAGQEATGYGLSFLLHALVIFLLFLFARQSIEDRRTSIRLVPIALIAESEGSQAEPAQRRATGAPGKIIQNLPRAQTAHHTPVGVAPNRSRAPEDEFDAKLEALSKLKLPNTDVRQTGDAGNVSSNATGNDAVSGGAGPYHARDIIRAQILRHWSLDMSRLGNRDLLIRIHVVLKRDGTVLEANVAGDEPRYKTDAVYRWIAISARNAVILSSPLTLPPGVSGDGLDMILTLDPRETLQ